MNESRLIILGASGHGKVVASTARRLGMNVVAFYDDNPALHSTEFFSSIVKGTINECFFQANGIGIFIAIGVNSIRRSIALKYRYDAWEIIKCPSALVDSSATLQSGSIVISGAIVQAGATIGEHCIINTRASVDHECVLSNYSQVAPGAILCGNVTLGECSYVGAGAVIKQGIKIGDNAMIGAGSVVVNDIPSNTLVFGHPAKVIKEGLFV